MKIKLDENLPTQLASILSRMGHDADHEGILVMRLRDPGLHALLNRIESLFKTESVENWKGCFVIATENKIRVRFPEK